MDAVFRVPVTQAKATLVAEIKPEEPCFVNLRGSETHARLGSVERSDDSAHQGTSYASGSVGRNPADLLVEVAENT
jgi:hypothetical protein